MEREVLIFWPEAEAFNSADIAAALAAFNRYDLQLTTDQIGGALAKGRVEGTAPRATVTFTATGEQVQVEADSVREFVQSCAAHMSDFVRRYDEVNGMIAETMGRRPASHPAFVDAAVVEACQGFDEVDFHTIRSVVNRTAGHFYGVEDYGQFRARLRGAVAALVAVRHELV